MRKIVQRTMVWLLALVAAVAIAPGLAFADSLTGGGLSVQEEDQSPWTDWADSDVVFTVKTEAADGQLESVEFTKAQMVEMAARNTEPAYYEFDKNGITVIGVNEYVTIDQLIAAANTTFTEGDKIVVSDESTGPRGAFTSALSYEEYMLPHYFYPNRLAGDKTSAEGAVETPSIIALSWGFVEHDGDSTAGSLRETALDNAYHGSLRNLWGVTEATFNTGSIGGKPYVTGAKSLTVYKPFKVYQQGADGVKTLVKSFYRDDFVSMAITDAARGFLFNKNGWQVIASKNFVPVSDILKGAFGDDFALTEAQTVIATALDGFSTYLPYAQYANTKYFYPAATSDAVPADGAEEVGTVLALTWESTDSDKGIASMADGAAAARNAIAEADEADLVRKYRLLTGLLSADDPNTGGNRFATGPAEITVVTMKDLADSSVTVEGVKASYDYTGEAIQPEVTVKDGGKVLKAKTKKGGDYEVAYGENTELGEGTVTITGVNSYTGTKVVKFKIQRSLAGATVTLDEASAAYTGKAQKGAVKSVVLDGATLVAGTDYTVSAASGTNVGSYKVTVTGAGKYYGTLEASFAITAAKLTAATAANATYTGKGLKPAVTVKAGSLVVPAANYTVAYANNKNVGTGTATITAKGKNVTGELTASFNIAQAANKVTLAKKSISKNLKAKKLAKKAATVALAKATPKFGKVKWTVAKKDSKKVLTFKKGKVKVKKGAKKGTYTIKLKASVAKTKNYKAAAAKLTVKVVVQ